MRTHDGGIENAGDILVADRHRAKDLPPGATSRPAMKAVVDRLPRSESLGEVAPRRACPRQPHDRVYEVAIARFRRPAWSAREQLLDLGPLVVRKFMPMHASVRSTLADRGHFLAGCRRNRSK